MPNCSNCKKPDASLPVDGRFANEPEGTQHFACSEPCQNNMNRVFQGIADRQTLADARLTCPCCGNTLSFFCGGPGSYWVECNCGSYSDMAPNVAALTAACSDPTKWHPAGNINCYPPIGG